MNTARVHLLALLLSISPATVTAQTVFFPEQGYWVSSEVSGRTFFVEIQDNELKIDVLTYAPPVGDSATSEPTWYRATGSLTSSTLLPTFRAPLQKLVDGPQIACSASLGTCGTATSSSVGELQILFLSPDQAEVTLIVDGGLGGSVIERVSMSREDRFDDGDITTPPLHRLKGEWLLMADAGLTGRYVGDRIQVTEAGSDEATGYRLGFSGRPLIAQWQEDKNRFVMIIDDSATTYTFFAFSFDGLNQFHGQAWGYGKGSSPTGSGIPFVASRWQGSGEAGFVLDAAPSVANSSSTGSAGFARIRPGTGNLPPSETSTQSADGGQRLRIELEQASAWLDD